MDDFEGTLNRVLSDPESMQKIFSIAQSLGMQAPHAVPAAPAKEETPAVEESLMPDLSMLSIMQKLMQNSGQANTRHTELLNALRPFLRPERQQSLDRAIRVAKLSHLARFALSSLAETPQGGAGIV